MRRSLLGHLVPLIRQPEPAATQALQYVLEAAPEVASAFVELLTGGRFEIGRVSSEWELEKGVRPDLAISDARGQARLLVENKFWAHLTNRQPVAYLRALPADEPSTLAFIAPEDRIVSLWSQLKDRCQHESLELADETSAKNFCRMRAGSRRLVLTSWRRVLDTLQRAAEAGGRAAIEQDIVQLRGLTERMNSDVFLPLRGDEPTDVRVARRMLNYAGLIDDITDRLVSDGIADVQGLMPSGWGRFLRMHARFGLWLGIDLKAWRNWGITPIWSSHDTKEDFSGLDGGVEPAKALFKDAQETNGRLYVPVRLKAGVERDRVIGGAVQRMRHIADKLRKGFPGG